MYYRLDDKYAFCGWKKLPYALRAREGEEALKRPCFFDKEDFLTLLSCNGEEDVDTDALPEKQKALLRQLVHEGVLTSAKTPMPPLASEQRYHVYPSVFLESIHWSITGKCNYHCRHCLLSAPTNRHPQLPLSDCLRIVDEIAACGVRQVDITGGEPLVRSDFFEIVKALSAHGIRIRLIFTNGSLLDEAFLDALNDNGQTPAFQLSYDGYGHHAWLRNVPGAEDRLKETIELLYRRGVPYSCAMCIHKENADSLADTVRYLAARGCNFLRLNTPQELGTWKEYSEEYALSWQEAWAVYRDYIPQYFKDGMPIGLELDGFFSCKAGSTHYLVHYVHHAQKGCDFSKLPYCESVKYNAYIDAEGRLTPCMGFADNPMAKDFPSLLTDDWQKASWDSFYAKVANTKIQQMIDFNPECQGCEHINRCCGGCMVEGTTPDGNWLHYDPHCCWFHKNVGEQAVREVADAAISQYAAEAKAREDAEEAAEKAELERARRAEKERALAE